MYVLQYYTTISNNVIWYCYMYMWHIWLNEMLPLMSRIVDLFNVSTTCNIKKTEKNKNWGNKTDNHHIFWDVATIICFSFFFATLFSLYGLCFSTASLPVIWGATKCFVMLFCCFLFLSFYISHHMHMIFVHVSTCVFFS